MLTSSSGTNYVIHENEDVDQYGSFPIPAEILLYQSQPESLVNQNEILKEARYKIIQNDRFSWKKNHVRTYRYDDSKYIKMILGYHATFFLLHAFESCMKFNFGPQIYIHIWCDYFMSESLVYTSNMQKLILQQRQLFLFA